VLKALPRRVNWEARIDGTPVVATGETRREVVDRAIAAARRKTDRGLPIGMGSARALRKRRTCGAKGNRTLGLDSAIVALYQLSYSPNVLAECSGAVRRCRRFDQGSKRRRCVRDASAVFEPAVVPAGVFTLPKLGEQIDVAAQCQERERKQVQQHVGARGRSEEHAARRDDDEHEQHVAPTATHDRAWVVEHWHARLTMLRPRVMIRLVSDRAGLASGRVAVRTVLLAIGGDHRSLRLPSAGRRVRGMAD
jgi:hypothetical protein